jgi:hypothetical protein
MSVITHDQPRWTSRPRATLAVNLTLTAALVALAVTLLVTLFPKPVAGAPNMPHSVVMERDTGVRFSRVAVVGDGGLLTVSYVVLDPEKATLFQSDRDHPPVLRSESRDASTRRVSIMRSGHVMRPGQTYYLVYENTGGALRPGERVTISYDGISLRHVPVL